MTDSQDTTAGKKPTNKREDRISPDGKWRSFPNVPNLLLYVGTGVYYARVKVNGKLIRRSLQTDVWSTARLKLADFLKEMLTPRPAIGTAGVGIKAFLRANACRHDIGPSTRKYWRDCVAVLLESWPRLRTTMADRITLEDCQEWAGKVAEEISETYFNNTLATFRKVLAGSGVPDATNPTMKIKRMGIHTEPPTLPERDQFLEMLDKMEHSGAGQAQHCSDLARFLAFSGQRIGVAKESVWGDVHLDETTRQGYITFRKNKLQRGKNMNVINNVPIIPELAELLIRLRETHKPQPEDGILHVHECQKALDRACGLVGVPRITHHDLRHLFASCVIEAGVDIPTLSRWLGHSDGGALAMRVYGHLRAKHSFAMAQRVSFAVVAPENVIPMMVKGAA